MSYLLRVVEGEARGLQTSLVATVLVGRADADLDLGDDRRASREHARVSLVHGEVVVEDLGSVNGTVVGNDRLTAPTRIAPGTHISMGESKVLLLRLEPLHETVSDPTAPQLRLLERGAGSRVLPETERLVIGRDPAHVDVHVASQTVSRVHCRVLRRDGGITIEDLGSSRGTFVNDERLGRGIALSVSTGDRVQLGDGGVELVVERASGVSVNDAGQVQLRVRREDDRRSWNVELETPSGATSADVAAALARYLGAPSRPWSGDHEGGDSSWCLYRESDGLLLTPDNLWSRADVRRGDELVIAPLRGRIAADPQVAPRLDPVHRRDTITGLPRALRPPTEQRPHLPSVPDSTSLRGRGLPWQIAAGMGGLVGGVLIGVLGHNPQFLIFGGVFAVAGLMSMAAGIFGDQSRRRFRSRRFHEQLADLDAELAEVVATQAETLRQLSPRVAQLADWARLRGDRLWERRLGDSDFLSLRLGAGTRPALLQLDEGFSNRESSLNEELDAVLDRHRALLDVPIVTTGERGAAVGLVGDPQLCDAMARSLVLQAAVLHSPQDLSIAVLDTGDGWGWLGWLPHVESVDGPTASWDRESTRTLALRLAEDLPAERDRLGQVATTARLVLVPAPALDLEEVRTLLEQARGRDWSMLVLAYDQRSLPPGVSVVVDCSATIATATGLSDATPRVSFVPEFLDPDRARVAVGALATFVDPRATTTSSATTSGLLELLGVASLDRLDPEALWTNRERPKLTAPIGVADSGATFAIDLRRDGPHGLIAGTTGSGKSELLLTLVASLALTNPPEALNFFLADYKGSATFADVAALPHTVGFVSDLDRSMVGRALRSLEAELDRRKRILADARVPDLVDYERLPEASTHPLSTLLVVVDEFAALVKELSDAGRDDEVARFGNIAIQGRSLGVHLLLAMQSPEGVVRGEIAKNTNLRLCLRVAATQESVDMIGKPDAARIPSDRQGRGFERLGAGDDIVAFQAARIRRPIDAEMATEVTVRPFADGEPHRTRVAPKVQPQGTRGTTELEVVCQRIVAAAAHRGSPQQRSLWLAPLPSMVEPPTLPPDFVDDPARLQVRLGLTDLPHLQTQATEVLDISAAANVLALGEFGSGKTTLLLQLGVDLAERRSPADVHLYAIDSGGGGLAKLEPLPHTAAVVAADDTERLDRMLGRLTRTIDERRRLLARDGAGDWLRWRATQSSPQPWLVLLVDDYPVLRETAEAYQYGSLTERFITVVQSGAQVGIHVCLATPQQSDLRVSLSNLFGARVLLRQSDPADYVLIGLRPSQVAEMSQPPGRAFIAGRPVREVQVLFPSEHRFTEAAERWSDTAGPQPVRRLPAEIELQEVFARTTPPRANEILLGVGGDEVEPVLLDQETAGPHLLILGDDRSGRSTALCTCFHAVSAANPTARFGIVAPRRSPVQSFADDPRVAWIATTADEIAARLGELEGASDVTHLLVDDATQLPQNATTGIEGILRDARERQRFTFFAARASDFTRSFESWARYLISMRVALLLSPTPDDGAPFDVRVPRGGARIAGRGFLVVREQITPLQVALPTVAPSTE